MFLRLTGDLFHAVKQLYQLILSYAKAMKTSLKIQIISSLLILLFVYAAMSKLLDFQQFKVQMNIQTFPHWLAAVLVSTLPEVELIIAGILVFESTRKAGLILSAGMLVIFTGYIGLVLLNYFGRVPCSCGGVIKALGWKMHLVFNLFFLLLSFLGIYFINRERSVIGKKI
jgi:putative oxidoreductase